MSESKEVVKLKLFFLVEHSKQVFSISRMRC